MNHGLTQFNTSKNMAAIWAGIAGSALGVGVGALQNNRASKANEAALANSQSGYEDRLAAAAEQAKVFSEQYNAAVETRPDLSWKEFVKSKIEAIDDPYLRQVYTQAKDEDYAKMQEFATKASKSNVGNLIHIADELSGGPGKFQELTKERDRLVMDTDAGSRLSRAYELAAPLRTGASTVKYDGEGNIIPGQRADAQVFNIAQEVQTATEQEKKQDLRQLEVDRIGAAQSQVEKARDFMPFFDATGLAIGIDDQRLKMQNAYQMLDEQRAFDMYSAFAQGAAGITPQQPAYTAANPGNDLIRSGIQLGTNAASALYARNQQPKPPRAQIVP